MSPLTVLLTLMREKWDAGDRDGAAELARVAAPYLHPRRSSTAQNAHRTMEPHRLSDAELARRLANPGVAGTADSPEDPDLPR